MLVMISGSRTVKSLTADAVARLEKLVSLGAEIVVGDCYGADSLVQVWLKTAGYEKVTVAHVGDSPRFNAGFATQRVVGSQQRCKDVWMCGVADYGLAIWDGKSVGTQANIMRLEGRCRVVMV